MGFLEAVLGFLDTVLQVATEQQLHLYNIRYPLPVASWSLSALLTPNVQYTEIRIYSSSTAFGLEVDGRF